MITKVTERQTGVRTIAGTEFPVRDMVQRQATITTDGVLRVKWVLVRGVCNGVAEVSS